MICNDCCQEIKRLCSWWIESIIGLHEPLNLDDREKYSSIPIDVQLPIQSCPIPNLAFHRFFSGTQSVWSVLLFWPDRSISRSRTGPGIFPLSIVQELLQPVSVIGMDSTLDHRYFHRLALRLSRLVLGRIINLSFGHCFTQSNSELVSGGGGGQWVLTVGLNNEDLRVLRDSFA